MLFRSVWSSLAKVDVDQALPKASSKPPPVPPKPEAKINVLICPKSVKVNMWNSDIPGIAKPEMKEPFVVPMLPGETQVCRKEGNTDCDKFANYDLEKVRAKLEDFRAAANQGDKTKVMVSAADSVAYTHLVDTLDSVLRACEKDKTSCVGPDGKKAVPCCLKNPAVGDSNLLRAEGFATLCD